MLVDAGADVTPSRSDDDLVTLAGLHGSYESAKILIRAGALPSNERTGSFRILQISAVSGLAHCGKRGRC